LTNVAELQANLGQFAEALQSAEQSLEIARRIGHRSGMGSALTAMTIANRYLGHLPEALALCEQALAIDRELGLRQGEATDLSIRGQIEGDLGQRDAELND